MESSKRHLENLIDGYFAGRLSFEQTEELFVLLKDDIDAVDQLLSGDMPSLVASSESFPHKNRLRKRFSDLPNDQFEYLCIASAEGDLNHEQQHELDAIIESDSARKEIYSTYKALRLKPTTEVYNSKHRLKRSTPAGRIIRMATIALSAAASVVILITAVNWLNNASEREMATTIASTPEAGKETGNSPAINDTVEVESDQIQTIKERPATVRSLPPEQPIIAYNEPATEAHESQVIERTTMPAPVSGMEARVILTSAASSDKLADVLYNDVIPYHGPISLKEHLAMNFREKILGEEIPDISPIKAYEIASAGISGISKLLGWEMDLEVKKETSGEVNALAFNSRLINFETPVKKAENEQ